MKKQIQVFIPKPCHENWQAMTPTQQGRYCAACSKQVIDFTMLTDQEILNHFEKAAGKTCGRFSDDQLQRPLVLRKDEKKKTWWLALLMPAMLLANKVSAQKKNNKQNIQCEVKRNNVLVMGKMIARKPLKEHRIEPILANTKKTVKGTVLNEQGEVIPYATVMIKETGEGTATDSSGKFELAFTSSDDFKSLMISAIGYKTKEQRFNGNLKDELTVELTQKIEDLPHVYLQTPDLITCRSSVCGISIISTVRKRDTIATAIRKALGNEVFKTFPNPAQRGELVQVAIKKQGNYIIQVLDQHSKLILVEEVSVINNANNTQLTLPQNIAAGMYYIRLVDEQTKKQYTDKLLIQ